MRKVVLDTNVIVSGTITPDRGHPAKILNAWQDGLFALVVSDDLIDEVKRILNKPGLSAQYHLTKADVGRIINLLRKHSIRVPGILDLSVIERDPDDDKIIIAAVEGAAEYIVTGDDDLLSLKTYRGIKIVTPAEFDRSF